MFFLAGVFCLTNAIKAEIAFYPYLWDYGNMAKTTIEISDSLLIRAKKKAIELGKPLRTIVESALRQYLSHISTNKRPVELSKRFHWSVVRGGIAEGLDIASRVKMHEWLSRHK